MSPETYLSLWDFFQDFQANHELALRRLQVLLLDEAALLERIAFLQAVAEEGLTEFPELVSGRPKDDFSAEMKLICETGLIRAYREGRLSEEQVRGLHRFSCSPDALLEAHGRLVGEEYAELAEPRAEGLSSTAAVAPQEEQSLLTHSLRLFPQAQEHIVRWFHQPLLRPLPQVAGPEVTLNLRNPGPMYITLLGDSGQAVWRSRLFADADEATVYSLSDDSAAVSDAVRFEDGHVLIDLALYPVDDRWRAFYLAAEEIAGASEEERELFILRRAAGDRLTAARARDPIELVIRGRLLDAWREAAEQGDMDDARLEVIVSMVFSQMEVLLTEARPEVVGSLRDQSLLKPLNSDLKSLPGLLDSFKQELRERMRPRMGAE